MWPFTKRETETRNSYTDQVVNALLSRAGGGASADVQATSAAEAASGAYARAFAMATIAPQTNRTMIGAGVLAAIARSLVRYGESLHVIEVSNGVLRFDPISKWELRGSSDPASWTYRIDRVGPSGTTWTRSVPGAQVVHCMWSVDPGKPWKGIGPMQRANLTGRLYSELEGSLADEAAGARGYLLPIPTDGNDSTVNTLREDLRTLKGKLAVVETTAAGFGEGETAAPPSDYEVKRIGPNPPASLATLRSQSGAQVLAACGVPIELFEGSSGTGQREAWRRFLHGSVSPIGELVAEELAAKLDTPELKLSFERLYASDLMGRSRSYGSLVKAGMEKDRAAELAGLN